MKKPVLCAVILCLQIAVADSCNAFTVLGPGSQGCGEWVIRRADKDRFWVQKLSIEVWVLGFLSGVSTDNKGHDILGDVDAESLFLWIDNYCKSNPLQKVESASEALAVELIKKAILKQLPPNKP
jgi:hypothetical protein